MLKRLSAAGLVDKTRDSGDERSVLLTLTAAGAALRQEALAVPHAVMARLGVDTADLIAMRDSLTHVITAATAAAH